jgi:hypothetical protein
MNDERHRLQFAQGSGVYVVHVYVFRASLFTRCAIRRRLVGCLSLTDAEKEISWHINTLPAF